jgi:hypothetical protein
LLPNEPNLEIEIMVAKITHLKIEMCKMHNISVTLTLLVYKFVVELTHPYHKVLLPSGFFLHWNLPFLSGGSNKGVVTFNNNFSVDERNFPKNIYDLEFKPPIHLHPTKVPACLKLLRIG